MLAHEEQREEEAWSLKTPMLIVPNGRVRRCRPSR